MMIVGEKEPHRKLSMTNEQVTYGHITQTPGVCGGKPRIAGHRIRVQDIAIEYA